MFGRVRKNCPHCEGEVYVVCASHWHDEHDSGMLENLRCFGCEASLFRELGQGVMTLDEHTAWHAARVLPKATLRR